MGCFKCLLILSLAISCRSTDLLPPSFELHWTISNSSEAFKVSLHLRTNPADSATALLNVHRVSQGVLDYREKNRVREYMMDTVRLSAEEFAAFSAKTRQAHLWEVADEIQGRGTGNYSIFEMKDDKGTRGFSIIGIPEDQKVRVFSEACEQLFHDKFPEVSCMESDAMFECKLSDRTKKKEVTAEKRITKRNMSISVRDMHSEKNIPIASDDFVELCRVLENNHAWQLDSNAEFEKKYPQEYWVRISKGGTEHSFRVYAPSRLSDRRYFNVVNALESIGALSGGL